MKSDELRKTVTQHTEMIVGMTARLMLLEAQMQGLIEELTMALRLAGLDVSTFLQRMEARKRSAAERVLKRDFGLQPPADQ